MKRRNIYWSIFGWIVVAAVVFFIVAAVISSSLATAT